MSTLPGLVFEDLYVRLKGLAHEQRAHHPGQTLNTTALVHELYLRMYDNRQPNFDCDPKFFAYAALAMRSLLVDRARARLNQKAGGDWVRVTLTGNDDLRFCFDSAEQVLILESAIERLKQAEPRAAQILELLYFAGLNATQVASLLQLSTRTVERDWRYARAFLQAELV